MFSRLLPIAKNPFLNSSQIRNCLISNQTNYISKSNIILNSFSNNFKRNTLQNNRFQIFQKCFYSKQISKSLFKKSVFNENSPNREIFLQLVRAFKRTVQIKNEPMPKEETLNIFKRFKNAYKQHGKILILCHFTTYVGWIVGFFFLSKSGLSITTIFDLFEKMHILSKETIESIDNKINNFKLENFLRNWYFNYVLSDSAIKNINEYITGETLKHLITAIMLCKLITPIRYLVTLGATKLMINIFKKRGIMPVQPPPGHSIKELYSEQKMAIRRRINLQKEKSRKFFKRNSFSELNKRRKLKHLQK